MTDRRILFVLVWLLTGGLASAFASEQDALTETVEQIVSRHREDRPWLGVAVGVIQNGEQSVMAFGQIGRDGDSVPVDGDTVFEIGSVTKAFTGILLADAVQRGEVKLDDPVNDHLPDSLRVPAKGDQPVTLLNLATHRSGLPVQPPGLVLFALLRGTMLNPYSKYKLSDLKNTLDALKPERKPGRKYEYSNLGVGILGHSLVHAAREDSYESLLNNRVLTPLKMDSTRVRLTNEMKDRLAPPQIGTGRRTEPWDLACLEACGGLRSSMHDMLKFAAASLEGDTELHIAIRESHKPQRPVSKKDRDGDVGLCWHLSPMESDGTRLIWHNGGTGGYCSYLAVFPGKGLAVCVLTNSDLDLADPIGIEIMDDLSPPSE